MRRIIVITGTPGSGKTTMAKFLSGRVKGSTLIHINDLVAAKHLYSSRDVDGTKIVNLKKLGKEVETILKTTRGNVILDGHLLCEIKVRDATAIVVREHIKTIMKRLLKRGYSKAKINDNLVSEAIDYCGARARFNYANVFEIMGGKDAKAEILKVMAGRKRKGETIDLLSELAEIIKKDPSILGRK
jgi:adenylate kinase